MSLALDKPTAEEKDAGGALDEPITVTTRPEFYSYDVKQDIVTDKDVILNESIPLTPYIGPSKVLNADAA